GENITRGKMSLCKKICGTTKPTRSLLETRALRPPSCDSRTIPLALFFLVFVQEAQVQFVVASGAVVAIVAISLGVNFVWLHVIPFQILKYACLGGFCKYGRWRWCGVCHQ